MLHEVHDLPRWPVGLGWGRVYRSLRGDWRGPMGRGWLPWPCVCAAASEGPGGLSSLVVLLGSQVIRFERRSDRYIARGGHDPFYALEHDGREGVYRLTIVGDDGGEAVELWDLEQTSHPKGLFRRWTDASGQRVTEATAHPSGGWGIGTLEHRVREGDGVRKRTLDYTYTTDGLINTATLLDGAGIPLRRASYTYDAEGCFEGAAVEEPGENGGWSAVARSHYRYYGPGEANGFAHRLKYAVEPAAYAAMASAGLDPRTAGEAHLDAFASHYFEYGGKRGRLDSRTLSRRMTRNTGEGPGSAGESFSYAANPRMPDPRDTNAWRSKTVRVSVDGLRHATYTNADGQVILRVSEAERDPGRRWHTFYKYDRAGRRVLEADAAAVSGFDENYDDLLGEQPDGSYLYLWDQAGLIRVTEYYSSTTADATSPGGVAGKIRCEKIKEGQRGGQIKLREWTYFKQSANGEQFYPIAARIVYPDEADQTKTITTSYTYEWYSSPARMKQRVTTLPAVPTDQNGDGTDATTMEYFDERGRLTWSMDERGSITRYRRDALSGDLIQRIDDADTERITDTPDVPEGWSTLAGRGEHRVSDFQYDQLGRQTQELGPEHEAVVGSRPVRVRHAKWTLCREAVGADETWAGRGYVRSGEPVLVEPVVITRRDKRGWTIDRIESTRTTGSGRLSPSDTFEQTDWTRWTHHELDGNGRTLATRVYHTIPASELGARAGAGEVGMHYDRTSYGYDPRTGLRVREVSPGGSITRTLRDPLGRPVAVWAGTDDRSRNGKGWQDWSPDNNGGDMVLVSERGYDDSRPLEERAVARTIEHVDAFTERITDHHYDFHYRRISTESEEGAYDERHYDNLDRVVLCEHYDGRGGNTLLEIASHRYDGRGRLEQTRAWSIDPAAGAVVRDEANHRRYDPAGRLIALVRSDESYVRHTYGGAEDPVETVRGRSSAGDALLLERTHTRYNAAGQVLLVSHERRPEPGRPLRVHHTAWWYDGAGRRIATARAETGEGDPSFIRPSTPPADSSRMQVATTRYNRAGEIEWEAEAAEETRSRYDHAGRLIRRTRHRSGGREDTSYAYTSDGRIESIRTHGPDGRRFTRYVYGVTLADSEFASSELMRAVERSDGRGGFERETFAYNAQGELVRRRDPKGHLHHYRYDRLGRLVGHSAGDDAVRTEAEHGASDRPSFSKSISSHFNGT